jgi:hypothetical protein
MDFIRSLEERSINAWPAFQTVLLDGWVFRVSKGHTKRANSANAIDPTMPFDEVRAASEYLYALHNLPTIFRLSPLSAPEIDKALDDAGYSIYDPSLVLCTPLSDTHGDSNVTIDNAPSGTWRSPIALVTAQERTHEVAMRHMRSKKSR